MLICHTFYRHVFIFSRNEYAADYKKLMLSIAKDLKAQILLSD